MEYKHAKLGLAIELKDFSQSQYETYHTKLLEYTKGRESVAVAAGAVVKAACDAGFLSGVKADEIGGMKPASVNWLTQKIHAHVLEIITPPADDPN